MYCILAFSRILCKLSVKFVWQLKLPELTLDKCIAYALHKSIGNLKFIKF